MMIFAAAVALHVAMFGSLFFGYLDGLFDNSEIWPKGIDFFSIYQGGTFALHGHTIYDWTAADSVPYAAPYRYLPFFAYTVGAAFTVLPPWTGYWLWVSLIEVMLVANARASFRVAPERRWGWIAASLWFAFSPVYLELYLGQWSFLMATLMLWTALLLHRGEAALSGVAWGASLLIKTNSALLGPIFLRLRQWRVLVLSGAALVLLNVPYFIFRPDDIAVFMESNFGQYYTDPPSRIFLLSSGDFSGMAYLRTVWLSLDANAADLPSWISRPVVLAIVGASFAATLLPRRFDVIAVFAIWICSYFLLYPAWEHHYVMLLPALALLVALRPEYRGVALFAFVMTAIPTPYFLFQQYLSDAPAQLPPAVGPQAYWPEWAAIVHHAMKPVPVFVLWGVLVWDQLSTWRQNRAAAGGQIVENT